MSDREETPFGRFLFDTYKYRNHLDCDQEAVFIMEWIKEYLMTGKEYDIESY